MKPHDSTTDNRFRQPQNPGECGFDSHLRHSTDSWFGDGCARGEDGRKHALRVLTPVCNARRLAAVVAVAAIAAAVKVEHGSPLSSMDVDEEGSCYIDGRQ